MDTCRQKELNFSLLQLTATARKLWFYWNSVRSTVYNLLPSNFTGHQGASCSHHLVKQEKRCISCPAELIMSQKLGIYVIKVNLSCLLEYKTQLRVENKDNRIQTFCDHPIGNACLVNACLLNSDSSSNCVSRAGTELLHWAPRCCN